MLGLLQLVYPRATTVYHIELARTLHDGDCIALINVFRAMAGNKFVEDPYTKARFHPQCTGQLSPVGDVAQIGADVSGLLCSPTQLR